MHLEPAVALKLLLAVKADDVQWTLHLVVNQIVVVTKVLITRFAVIMLRARCLVVLELLCRGKLRLVMTLQTLVTLAGLAGLTTIVTGPVIVIIIDVIIGIRVRGVSSTERIVRRGYGGVVGQLGGGRASL